MSSAHKKGFFKQKEETIKETIDDFYFCFSKDSRNKRNTTDQYEKEEKSYYSGQRIRLFAEEAISISKMKKR